MQLHHGLTLGLIALSLVGCARFGFDNGSLDYKNAQALDPLKVPTELQMRPQQSLYPAPNIDPRALEQAPELINKYGNRFEMPRPQTTIQQGGTLGQAPSRPQLVVDGNRIPLLKVDGGTEQVWRYVLATLSTSNMKYAERKQPNEVTLKYQDQEYILRLTSSGISNTLGVYDAKNNFVDATIANEVLNQIYQNWPA